MFDIYKAHTDHFNCQTRKLKVTNWKSHIEVTPNGEIGVILCFGLQYLHDLIYIYI